MKKVGDHPSQARFWKHTEKLNQYLLCLLKVSLLLTASALNKQWDIKEVNYNTCLRNYLGPILCIDFAAEHMSVIVSNCDHPSKVEASFKFGVTMSAIGRRSVLR